MNEMPFAWRTWTIEETTKVVMKGQGFDALIAELRETCANYGEFSPARLIPIRAITSILDRYDSKNNEKEGTNG